MTLKMSYQKSKEKINQLSELTDNQAKYNSLISDLISKMNLKEWIPMREILSILLKSVKKVTFKLSYQHLLIICMIILFIGRYDFLDKLI